MKRFFLILPLLLVAFHAHAATLTFDPQEQVVGLRSPFQVGLMLTSSVPVNTVHITLTLPEGITPLDVSDGNSIINFWISNPHFDEATRRFSFEGLIPGGFSGEGGRLLVLTLQAAHPGGAVIVINPNESELYRNSATAEREPLSATPLTLRVSSTKENVLNVLPDTVSPEAFVPLVSRTMDTYGGKWMLVFATQDKGTGVDHYDVREVDGVFPFLKTSWRKTDSPYVLTDQRLASTIFVRAVDKDGNERIEMLPPVYPLPWYEKPLISYILIAGALLLSLFGYALIRHSRRARL